MDAGEYHTPKERSEVTEGLHASTGSPEENQLPLAWAYKLKNLSYLSKIKGTSAM